MCSIRAVLLCLTLKIALCYRTDKQYWTDLAQNELEEALRVKWNEGTAKNVILFVGDGMGLNTITVARINQGGESHRLAFEKFPHVGLIKTYSANKIVPDSASTATALFTGVKVNQQTIGVDANVSFQDCAGSLQPEYRLKSLAALALEAGKSAGFVTTMRVTHATPSPLYAHSAHRKWECEADMPPNSACKDIARQLVEDWPGKDLHVILGGGRQVLVSNSTGTEGDPISEWSCYRQDGRNLIQEYMEDKRKRDLKYSYVTNTGELKDIDVDNTDYLLGIFANAHLSYEFERDKSPKGMPSISEMVEAAIKVLQKNENGYFLMVEGGNIDMAHHRGRAKTAVSETEAMELAVQSALKMTNDEDTLLIVTSDHSHTLAINGYPYRETNMFGMAGVSSRDGKNYTTLSYGNGGPGSFQFGVEINDKNESVVTRRDPNKDDTDSYHYEQISGITLEENYHGGSDVAVYALGPYAHLFHNVHEQNYIFHVISYAAKIGAYSGSTSFYCSNILLFSIILATVVVMY